MKKLVPILLLNLMHIFSTIGNAQTINPPIFTPDRFVNDIASKGDTMIVAGNFGNVGKYTGGLAMFTTTSDQPNPAFPRMNLGVSSSTSDGNGGYYFFQWGAGIHHIFSNQTIDTSFYIPLTYSSGADEYFEILYSNGVIYIGGENFVSSSTTNIGSLMAFDATTQQRIINFPTANHRVFNLRINSNKLYFTGSFDTVGGLYRKGVACIDLSNYTLTSWYPNLPSSSVFNGNICSLMTNQVGFSDIVFDGDYAIIGGYFPLNCGVAVYKGIRVNLTSGAFNRFLFPSAGLFAGDLSAIYFGANVVKMETNNNILFLATSGTFDTRITAVDLSTITQDTVSVLWARYFNMIASLGNIVVSGNSVFVAGEMDNIYAVNLTNSNASNLEQPVGNAIKLNASTGALEPWNPNPLGTVYALTLNGNNLFMGGSFSYVNNYQRQCVYMMRNSTQEILPFKINASFLENINEIKIIDSTVYLVGDWAAAYNASRNTVRAYNINTGAQLPWNPGYLGEAFTVEVNSQYVFIGGNISDTSGGVSKTKLLAIDRASGQVINWAPNPNYNVNSLHLTNEKLFVGGEFSTLSGQSRNKLGAYDAATLALTTWTPATLNGSVQSIKSSGSLLWVGGQFSTVNGINVDKFAGLSKIDGTLQKYTSTNTHIGNVYDLYQKGESIITGNSNTTNNYIDTCGSPFTYKIINNNIQKVNNFCLRLEGTYDGIYAVDINGNDLYYGGIFFKTNSELKGTNLGRISLPLGYFPPAPIAQEIDIEGYYNSISNGDITTTLSNFTNFGASSLGNNIVKTFTILNNGNSNLNINNILVSGLDASQFSISTLPPSNIIQANSYATFSVTFTPISGGGIKNAVITILNNDDDESNFNFAISAYDGAASALNFDGVNDYVAINNEPNFDFANSLTIEAWIKVGSFTKTWQSIVTKGNNSWRLHRYSNSNFIGFATNGLSNVELVSTININDGSWHHIAAVYDGVKKYIYIDGTLNVSINATGSVSNSAFNVAIGENLQATGRQFHGTIDEVRIWNSARTQAQIQSKMNCEINTNTSGLVANFHFNQGAPNGNNATTTQLNDSSGNNDNGLLTNFTLIGASSNWVYPGAFSNGTSCENILNLKLFLQGYYIGGGAMTNTLLNQGVNTNSTICDSITVELRSQMFPYYLIESKTIALNTNGNATYLFNNSGTYYIIIKHRNCLQTWSALPVSISPNTSYDFTVSANKAYGENMIELEAGKWALYSGDINHDENIDLLDMSVLESDINIFQFGNVATDINGDGNVDLLDLPVIETNVNNFIFSNHP